MTLLGAWTTSWSTTPRPEKTNDGSDEGQARADHGPRERQIARLGHCEGAARRGRRTRHQLSRRGDAEAGEAARRRAGLRSEEHTSELQSLMRISYAVFCLKKKTRPSTKYRARQSNTTLSHAAT